MKWIIDRNGISKEITVRDLTPEEKSNLNPENSFQSDKVEALFKDQANILPPIELTLATLDRGPFTVYPSGISPFIAIIANIMSSTLKVSAPQINNPNGSGNYKVQAKGNNLAIWTDLESESGVPNIGSFIFPDIAIDPLILLAGGSYVIRVIDTTTNLSSNEFAINIPNALVIRGYSAGHAIIDFVNDVPGTDSYSVGFHAAPTSFQAGAGVTITGYQADIEFWQTHVQTVILNSNLTVDNTTPVSGHGAGVYKLSAQYSLSDGTNFTVSRTVLVDASGNILVDLNFNGITISAVSGDELTAEVNFTDSGLGGATIDIGWVAIDNSGNGNQIGSSNPATMTIPAGTVGLIGLPSGISSGSNPFANDFNGDILVASLALISI